MRKLLLALAGCAATLGASTRATAAEPSRDRTWGGVTAATAVAAVTVGLAMPRMFYAGAEVTGGFHARWHVSQLAPVMTIATLAFVNENFLKAKVAGPRPGCDDTNAGGPGCTDFGAPSTHAFVAGSTLGHGLAVFFIDTTKWSDGNVSGASVVGNILVPLILGGFTLGGRAQGNFETGGQLAAGATVGLGVGILTGLVYSTMAKPECGYLGGVICW